MKTVFILSVVATVGLFVVFWALPYMDKPEFTDLSLDVPAVDRKSEAMVEKPIPKEKRPKLTEESNKSIPAEKSREGAVPLAPVPTESLSYGKIKSEVRDFLDMAGKASPLATIGIAWWSKKKRKGKKRPKKAGKKK